MANLSPESKAYLEAFNQMPAMHEMDPQSVRNMMAEAPVPELELEPVAKVEDKLIPGYQGEEIKVRIYTPEGEGPFPVFVYYHGGGWVLGDIEISDPSCRVLANKTKHVVVSVDYRLSPEYKFPVPVEDAYAALTWVKENASSLNVSDSNIVVGGDSAGGNLAAALTHMTRDRKGPEISAQVLIYPVTDLSYDTGSYKEFAVGFGLDRKLMIWFGDHYVNNQADTQNVYAAPLRADKLDGLPPAFVITCENDVLRDEGKAYADKLSQSGVPTEYFCQEGIVHGYFTNMAVFPNQIHSAIEKVSNFLR
ncbi:alpha/beta hydrolase [Virgibacillus kekensis]|uniref:Alpha/beta hydrolase n=1 Tax=Virgibacillus kekensis TaxID=202261 RepID=A0ABV9DPK5_9BACI